MISKWEKKKKPVYLYDINMNFLQEFKTTDDFADYSGYSREYVTYNLKYYKKIWVNYKWHIIKREKI